MGKSIVIREEKYFNEFKNGVNFTDNLTDFTNNFTGMVMEKEKVRFVLDVSWGFVASASNSVSSNSTTGQLSRSSGDWENDGFSVGGEFDMEWIDDTGAKFLFSITIDSISGNLMFCTPSVGSMPDSDANGFINGSVVLTGQTDLTALIWKFGLVENSGNFNYQNLITNSDQAYYGSGLNFLTWVDLQPLGTSNKDWVSGKLRCRRVATGQYGIQKYEVEHELIVPFYSEGDNFVQMPDYLDGLNTLKYSFQSSFRTVLSNPNTEKTFTYDSSLGSIAYYGENYNGFNNIFSIVGVTYQEANTLNNADGLIASGKTKVTIEVSRSSGSFLTGGRYGVYVGYQATQDEYTNTPLTDFKENFIYDRELGAIATTTTGGDVFIQQMNSQIVGGNLVITFNVEYPAAQKVFLSNKLSSGQAKFIIAASVGDISLDSGNSNRIMLLARTGEFDFNADIPGLIQNTEINLFTYKDDIDVDPGKSSIQQWNEDGFLAKGKFDLNVAKNGFLNSLEFRLIAHNPTTSDFFILDRYIFNVISSPVVNGIQEINENNIRGYNLANGNRFKNAILTTSPNPVVGGLKTYNFEIGQKIKWQDWILNNDVNNVFYDNSKDNDNFNYKSSNYSLKEGYEIKAAIYSNVYGTNDENVSGTTDYLITTPGLEINDYDVDGNTSIIWSGIIETINPSNGTSLQGAILGGSDNTLFRITWTNSNGPVASINDISIIHRIEEAFQNGDNIDENGDSRLNPNNNRLINKNGFTEVDIYISDGKVISECLIKGSNLTQGIQYSLSGKLVNENPVIQGKLMSPTNDVKDTSGIVENKIESI